MKRQTIKRKKALLGADGAMTAAAIMASSAANVGAQYAAARQQASAMESAAQAQASAIKTDAELNANAIEKQTQNNTELQQKMIDENKRIHKEEQQQRKDIQMTLQAMAGGENEKDRQRQAMQQVKYGGKASLKHSLRGGSNAEFAITDGGSVEFKGKTPEGYDLYKFKGDTHEESHKLPNGKRATGVGVDLTTANSFAYNKKKYGGKADIEAEGGEYVLSTPKDVLFISKHNIGGFNPSKAIEHGTNPIDAFDIQEMKKEEIGINKNKHMDKRKLRNGGVVKGRLKAALGYNTASLIGSGLGIAGNFIGAGITNRANNRAAGIMSSAYNDASNVLVDAYGRMKGIDENAIKESDYSAAHYLPALRSQQVSAAPQIYNANKAARRALKAVKNNSASSAAALNRINDVEERRYAQTSAAYDAANKLSQAIAGENQNAINSAASQNAYLDTNAKQNYANQRMELLKYNNEIENSKIAGIAQAKSNAITQGADIEANRLNSNAQTWGNAIVNSVNMAGNTLSSMAQNYENKQMALGSMTDAGRANYYANNGGTKAAEQEYNYWNNIANDPNASAEDKKYASRMAGIIDNKRGFSKRSLKTNSKKGHN